MPKYKSRRTRLDDAMSNIRTAQDEIETLLDEVTSWKDGMDGTNLEHSQKYQDLEAVSEILESGKDEVEQGLNTLEDAEFPVMY